MSEKLDARTSELVAISRLDAQVSFDHSTVTQTIRNNPRSKTQQIWRRDHRELGRGGFAAVYLERSDGEVRAVKKPRKLRNDEYSRELAIAALFSRATRFEGNFVQSFGWYETPEEIFLTMEYLHLGDLSRYIATPLPETEVQTIMLQIMEGLVFMHELSYVHRDLKPANILVAQCGPHWWVKIADFGISKRAGFGTELRTLAFTPGYAAPEVASIESRGRQASSYTNAVDIWSAGMLTYAALMGLASAEHANSAAHDTCATIDHIKYDLDTNNFSAQCRDFVMQALHSDPCGRPAAVNCLNHDWLKSVVESTIELPSERPVLDQSPSPMGPLDGQEPSARWSTVLATARQATTVPPPKVEAQEPSARWSTATSTIAAKTHSERVCLRDEIGRQLYLDWDDCKSWAGMHKFIRQEFVKHVDSQMVHYIETGQYDLEGPDGTVIAPEHWESLVQPGWVIVLKLRSPRTRPQNGEQGRGGAREDVPSLIEPLGLSDPPADWTPGYRKDARPGKAPLRNSSARDPPMNDMMEREAREKSQTSQMEELYDEFKRKKKETMEREAREKSQISQIMERFDEFRRKKKEKDEEEDREKRKRADAEKRFQDEMRQRLEAQGYTDQNIEIMVDEEKTKAFQREALWRTPTMTDQTPVARELPTRAPVYPKVHKDYLELETLQYYQLPWRYDRDDPGFIIIQRDMDKRHTDVLFEHTARIRRANLESKSPKKK